MYRRAGQVGLIEDVERWFNYLRARNLTSHTYNEEIAEQVYDLSKEFIKDAEQLLVMLEKKNANSTL